MALARRDECAGPLGERRYSSQLSSQIPPSARHWHPFLIFPLSFVRKMYLVIRAGVASLRGSSRATPGFDIRYKSEPDVRTVEKREREETRAL